MSGLIWTKKILHSDGIRDYFFKKLILKKKQMTKKAWKISQGGKELNKSIWLPDEV